MVYLENKIAAFIETHRLITQLKSVRECTL
jgi:hypothetical protein